MSIGDQVCMKNPGHEGHAGRISAVVGGSAFMRKFNNHKENYYVVGCECGAYGFLYYD